jgi:peptide-methionine (S)-S-oxide reductase
LIQRATLSGGCFEKLETRFKILVGVLSTKVGYCKDIDSCNNSVECHDNKSIINAIDIEFDATIITYQNLLTIFFQVHNPTTIESSHLASTIFFHDNTQEETAHLILNRLNSSVYKDSIKTKIKRFSSFIEAEEKYQDNTVHNLA